MTTGSAVPTGEDRRSRTRTTTATMYGMWPRLAVSALTAATVSIIPTEYYGRLLDRNYHSHPKYWWLRSPVTNYSDVACLVHPSGDVGYYGYGRVLNSYGHKNSPGTDTQYDAEPFRVYHILNNGTFRYMYGDIFDSYGMIHAGQV